MAQDRNPNNFIGEFISSQVVGRGLDERTFKAYQKDLELFYLWMEHGDSATASSTETGIEERMETYLTYLSKEKGLRMSTVRRKQRVLGYYLSYLAAQGKIKGYQPLKPIAKFADKTSADETAGKAPQMQPTQMQPAEPADGYPAETGRMNLLTKGDVDAFFAAISREYEKLDSDFRRRVCLRDQVMMGLLFYHGIEISELLRLEVGDYDRKTALLTVRRKRERERTVFVFSKALQKQMTQWLEEHEYFERDEMYSNRMFLSKMGKPLSMKMVINIFDKYRVLAGIGKEYKPKDLKNSLGQYAREMVWELG